MRILVTGASGMVGRNLLVDPRSGEHEILSPARGELDLTDTAQARDYVAAARPDLIIHLAGLVGGIAANIAQPERFRAENLAMGINILRAGFAARVPRLINLGSSCMYPKDSPRALTEDRLLSGPLEPTNEGYARAKLAVWELARAMRRARPELAWVTMIPPNLYGPYDHFDPSRSHLIAAAIAKIAAAARDDAARVEIWGDGTARREFLFAPDLADFIWRHVEGLEALPETLNVGVGEDHSVDDYYAVIGAVLGYRGRFVHDLAQPTGMRRKLLDVGVQTGLGWRPRTSLRAGIEAAAAYHRSSQLGVRS